LIALNRVICCRIWHFDLAFSALKLMCSYYCTVLPRVIKWVVVVEAMTSYGTVGDTPDDDTGGMAEPLLLRAQHRCITLLGWSFDVFCVLISVTDVIADILVAYQFFTDGHRLWGWLVLGCLINSNLVYSVLVVAAGIRGQAGPIRYLNLPTWFRKLPFVLLLLIVFPFAQLAPSVGYIVTTALFRRVEGEPNSGDDVAANLPFDATNEVEREVQATARHNAASVSRLVMALQRQIYTHGLLFAETIVESIPQSVVQLMAITFLGTPTTTQVVSLALSVLSVISKGYSVSVSCDMWIVVSKFFMVSFDVCSMFYIFATILSEERLRERQLFGWTEVSTLTYVWVIKVLVGAAVTLVVTAVGMIAILINGPPTLKESFIGLCSGVLAQFPALVVQEGSKFSYLIAALTRVEPQVGSFAKSNLALSFLRTEGGGSGSDHKLHLLMEFMSAQQLSRKSDHYVLARSGMIAVHGRDAYRFLCEFERRGHGDIDAGVSSCFASSGEMQTYIDEYKSLSSSTRYAYVTITPIEVAIARLLAANVIPRHELRMRLDRVFRPGSKDAVVSSLFKGLTKHELEYAVHLALILRDAASRDYLRGVPWNSFGDDDDVSERTAIADDVLSTVWLWRAVVAHKVADNRRGPWTRLFDRVMFSLIFVWWSISFLLSLISAAYPFIDAARRFHNLTLLQAVFFYGASGSLAVVVLTVPLWVTYVRLLPILYIVQEYIREVVEMRTAIGRFYLPSCGQILLHHCPKHLLPRDIVRHTLTPMMAANDVTLRELKRDSCAKYRAYF